MKLSQVNIKELSFEKTLNYMTSNQLSYNQLRQSLLSLTPPADIIDVIDQTLLNICELDKQNVKAELEKNFCLKQFEEDQSEAKSDIRETHEDEEQRKELLKALEEQQQAIGTHKSNIKRYQSQLNHLPQQISHDSHHVDHQSGTPSHQHGHTTQVPPQNVRAELQSRLDDEKRIKSKLKKKSEIIKRELEITLPLRQEQRHARSLERSKRNQARVGVDNNFTQLSESNLLAMKKEYHQQQQELDKLREKLQSSAREYGYSNFINALGVQTMTHLSESSQKALVSIINLMLTREEVKLKEQQARSSLKLQQGRLNDLNTAVDQRRKELEQLRGNNPQRDQQNELLLKQNNELSKIADERLERNDSIIFAALISLIPLALLTPAPWVLVSLGILTGLSPTVFLLLFIPAAINGIISAGLTLSAAIYGIMNYLDRDTIEKNRQTIDLNTETINVQSGNILTIETVELPKLNNDILLHMKEIQTFEGEINHHINVAEKLHQQATQIVPVETLNPSIQNHHTFFANSQQVTSSPITANNPHEINPGTSTGNSYF